MNAEYDEYRIMTKVPPKRTFSWISWSGAGPWSSMESAQKSIDEQVHSLAQGYEFQIQHRHVRTESTEWVVLSEQRGK